MALARLSYMPQGIDQKGKPSFMQTPARRGIMGQGGSPQRMVNARKRRGMGMTKPAKGFTTMHRNRQSEAKSFVRPPKRMGIRRLLY